MVTSNKFPEKKVVRMNEQNNSVVVPQRTLLGEVNEHITCPLCRGYYIDATTIVECLHSFCRSCIIKHLQVKSYCPVCEMMINSAKPNIKLDKALQDIVYKLVPGLFQREMERRQLFYASRPGTAATATPEQRGEDTERIIFSPEDVISFSLEYADVTDTDSISSKSSDSNEAQTNTASCRRYLQCPAVVNISHLKKFLSMKFNIDCTQFAVDILYKRVPLPDYYTLMDIAYIYNWKRNEPMRFFYQITDYISIRNRIFEVNRKEPHFQEGKHIPSEDNDNNSAPNLLDHGSEISSGADSPMHEDNSKSGNEKSQTVKADPIKKVEPVKMDEEVEKSQFLNSFELTAKSNSSKLSPSKSTVDTTVLANAESKEGDTDGTKNEDSLKRKQPTLPHVAEMKKLKIEIEKAKVSSYAGATSSILPPDGIISENKYSSQSKPVTPEAIQKPATLPSSTSNSSKDLKPTLIAKPLQATKSQTVDSPAPKRPVPSSQTSSPKRKPVNESQKMVPQNTVSPLKVQVPKLEPPHQNTVMLPKTQSKKMPDLKPSVSASQANHSKAQQQVPKLRMDLLANNSDPTIDRSKILSQVKTSLGTPPSVQLPSASGDPLKTLFDSCKINIPSSLSITLTDQKQDVRAVGDQSQADTKKMNKNLSNANSTPAHKVPCPPVHNYIEILKLPDTEGKKQNKTDGSTDEKVNTPNKQESSSTPKTGKTESSSAKGPIPNLKPIADTKLGKNLVNAAGSSITFQQTFEKQLANQQTDKKNKTPKTKGQVPKLVPATAKTFSAATKLNTQNKVTSAEPSPPENKPNTALDLSTAPNIQQSKAFETMQTIANLAKKQSLPPKAQSMTQSNIYSAMSPRTSSADIARSPTTSIMNQIKFDKLNSLQSNNGRQDTPKAPTQLKPVGNPQTSNSMYQMHSGNTATPSQPSPRQTRSPSSSPKLVIAEEKQPTLLDQNINQSNQISSSQIPSNSNPPKSDLTKTAPGPSKPVLKATKSIPIANKIPSIRQPITPTINPNPVLNPSMDYLSQPQLMHHALLRHQMEVQTAAWLKARHDLIKNITNIAHQNQNDFNSRDQQ